MKKIIAIFIFIFILFSSVNICNVQAQTSQTPSEINKENSSSATANKTALRNPLGSTDIPTLIGKVINSLLGIVGSIALLMFIYGGVVWMTASGNSQSVEKGRNIIMWAVIGLIVIFSSYGLVKFIIEGIK
ncbi:MAG: pilin [bacterium]